MDFAGYCYPVCHDDAAGIFNAKGPHGNYSATSGKCDNCHTVHNAPSDSIMLLPEPTIMGTCFTCHDGTGGRGVYGAIAARGLTPGSAHRIDVTDEVPGGDALTGGMATGTFKGTDSSLTCTDCHSAHGANCVAPFQGERVRNEQAGYGYVSNRLLRKLPTSGDTTVTVYGSDWCLACHKGRTSSGAVHNHPVDTIASAAPGTPFDVGNVAVLASDDPTATTVMSGLLGAAGTRRNGGFLMPYPRTPQQAGHAPICQQCHEDARDAGQLVGDGSIGDTTPTVIGLPDGQTATDNPRFQTFPHEAVNDNLLLETDDNLCMNCHPVAALP